MPKAFRFHLFLDYFVPVQLYAKAKLVVSKVVQVTVIIALIGH